MVDWNTGAPNARFRVLELLKSSFGPGDKIVESSIESPYIYGFAAIKPSGERKLLLVNKRDRDFEVTLPQPARQWDFVDQTTKSDPPASEKVDKNTVALRGLAVGVVTF